MNATNGRYLIIIQAALVASIFVALIGVYIFNTNNITHTRDVLLDRTDDLSVRMTTLELAVTNHCSRSDLRLDRIETDVSSIQTLLQDIMNRLNELD